MATFTAVLVQVQSRAPNRTTGQIDFCVNICKKFAVEPRKDDAVVIAGNYGRIALVKHVAMFIQKALDITTGFSINIDTVGIWAVLETVLMYILALCFDGKDETITGR